MAKYVMRCSVCFSRSKRTTLDGNTERIFSSTDLICAESLRGAGNHGRKEPISGIQSFHNTLGYLSQVVFLVSSSNIA